MISSNVGEVASIFLTAALGLPEGLIPVQLLWVNLVTDGPPATALGFNPPDPDIMTKPPRPSDEELITPWLLFRWLAVGAYVGSATVGIFAAWYLCPSFLKVLGLDPSLDGHAPVSWKQLTRWTECEASWFSGASGKSWGAFFFFEFFFFFLLLSVFGGERTHSRSFSSRLSLSLPLSFPCIPKQKKPLHSPGGLNDKFGYSLAGGGRVSLSDPCDLFAAAGKAKASTLSLSVLVAIEMFNALNALSEDNSLLTVPPTRNPWLLAAMAVSFGLHFLIVYVPPLASVFSIVPLTLREWGLVALFSLPVVLIDEVLKLAGRAWWRRENAKRRQQLSLSSSSSGGGGKASGGAAASAGASRRGRSPARKNASENGSSGKKAAAVSPRRTRGSSKASA